jgi:hypothetical protein
MQACGQRVQIFIQALRQTAAAPQSHFFQQALVRPLLFVKNAFPELRACPTHGVVCTTSRTAGQTRSPHKAFLFLLSNERESGVSVCLGTAVHSTAILPHTCTLRQSYPTRALHGYEYVYCHVSDTCHGGAPPAVDDLRVHVLQTQKQLQPAKQTRNCSNAACHWTQHTCTETRNNCSTSDTAHSMHSAYGHA